MYKLYLYASSTRNFVIFIKVPKSFTEAQKNLKVVLSPSMKVGCAGPNQKVTFFYIPEGCTLFNWRLHSPIIEGCTLAYLRLYCTILECSTITQPEGCTLSLSLRVYLSPTKVLLSLSWGLCKHPLHKYYAFIPEDCTFPQQLHTWRLYCTFPLHEVILFHL
jgi:hypothetical protein